jgi:hypothetical protein
MVRKKIKEAAIEACSGRSFKVSSEEIKGIIC